MAFSVQKYEFYYRITWDLNYTIKDMVLTIPLGKEGMLSYEVSLLQFS